MVNGRATLVSRSDHGVDELAFGVVTFDYQGKGSRAFPPYVGAGVRHAAQSACVRGLVAISKSQFTVIEQAPHEEEEEAGLSRGLAAASYLGSCSGE